MACSALIINIIVQSASANASISHSLHDLTPAPYLQPNVLHINQQLPIPYFHNKAQSPVPNLYHRGLTPVPYPHNNYQTPNPKYSQDWYHHVVGKDRQPYQNTKQPMAPEYTVYRNPYDVTGPREGKDAVQTQDGDVSLCFSLHGCKH